MLDENQVDLIVKELIKASAISVGKNSGLYSIIETKAINLGYIQSLQYMKLNLLYLYYI